MTTLTTLARRIESAPNPEAFYATVCCCLERCRGDLQAAVDLADIVDGEMQFANADPDGNKKAGQHWVSEHKREGDEVSGYWRRDPGTVKVDKKDGRGPKFTRPERLEGIAERKPPQPSKEKSRQRHRVEEVLQSQEFQEKLTQRAARFLGSDLRTQFDPEDVAQEAVSEALKDADQLPASDAVEPWLMQLVKTTAQDFGRIARAVKRNKAQKTSLDEEIGVAEEVSQATGVSPELIIGRALRQLPADDAKLIDLTYGLSNPDKKYTQKEIGKRLKVPHGAMRARLSRARKRLKELIEEQHGQVEEPPLRDTLEDPAGKTPGAVAGKHEKPQSFRDRQIRRRLAGHSGVKQKLPEDRHFAERKNHALAEGRAAKRVGLSTNPYAELLSDPGSEHLANREHFERLAVAWDRGFSGASMPTAPDVDVRGGKKRKAPERVKLETLRFSDEDHLAGIADAALNDAYGYGLAQPGSFGAEANCGSVRGFLRAHGAGHRDEETLAAAVHEGWGDVAKSFEDPAYQHKPEKRHARLKLANTAYHELPEEEKEKDRVVVRALLAHLGQQFDDAGSHNVDPIPDHIAEVGQRAALAAMDEARRAIVSLVKKKSVGLDDPRLLTQIEDILNEVQPSLEKILAETTLAGAVRGADDVLRLLPEHVLAISGPRQPPSVPTGHKLLFPDSEPIVRFPVLEAAAERIAKAEVIPASNFYQLGSRAREHAFTISGELTKGSVEKIKDVLFDNLAKGADPQAFVRDVGSLFEEGMPLSRAQLNQVFRNNVNAAWSDGHTKALSHPLIDDALPYAALNATHDQRVRDEHMLMEHSGLSGTNIYLRSDPVFRTFRGPWDYGCRCSWGPATISMAARRGVEHAQRWLDEAAKWDIVPEHLKVSPEHVPWPTLNGKKVEPPQGWKRETQFDAEYQPHRFEPPGIGPLHGARTKSLGEKVLTKLLGPGQQERLPNYMQSPEAQESLGNYHQTMGQHDEALEQVRQRFLAEASGGTVAELNARIPAAGATYQKKLQTRQTRQALRQQGQKLSPAMKLHPDMVSGVRHEMRRNTHSILKKHLGLPEGEAGQVAYVNNIAHRGAAAASERANEFLSGLVHKSTADNHHISVSTAPKEYHGKISGHYLPDSGTVEITPDAFGDVGTLLHEFGHTIEAKNPEVLKLLHGFLMSRAHRGGAAVAQHPEFSSYGGMPVVGHGMDWTSLVSHQHYAGVVPLGQAGKKMGSFSEVLSEGLHALYNDPVAFAQADPEYFKLVIGILSGRFAQPKGAQ